MLADENSSPFKWLENFNESLIFYPPKGHEEEDSNLVVRSASDTRPISCKNTDNKIIVGASVVRFYDFAQVHFCKNQRGFVANRNFPNNIVDLDSAARIYSMYHSDPSQLACINSYNIGKRSSLIPILAFFDFMAAFPSIIHGWIFAALKSRNMPEWFTNLVLAIYYRASAHAYVNGVQTFLFYFLSGVLQGCPASAFLFNIAVDPFLFAFEKILREKKAGIYRACADDIGAALKYLKCLIYMKPIFHDAEVLAGLGLKPVKCVIVPLVQGHKTLAKRILEWLARNIPEWANFKIKPAGKYLGFMLGPRANETQWSAPFSKYSERVDAVYSSGAGISVSVFTYNTRVLPVLSYVSQLVPTPQNSSKAERRALQRITHVAGNSLYTADFFHLQDYGGPKIRALEPSAKAALFRTAYSTVSGWHLWLQQLKKVAGECLPFASARNGSLSPTFWDSSPLALNLDLAYSGFDPQSSWRKGIDAAKITLQDLGARPGRQSIGHGGTFEKIPLYRYSGFFQKHWQ